MFYRLDRILLSDTDLTGKLVKALSSLSLPESILYYHVGKLKKNCNLPKENFKKSYELLMKFLYSDTANYADPNSFRGALFSLISKYKIQLEKLAKGKCCVGNVVERHCS